MYLLEELLSPLFTPLILMFKYSSRECEAVVEFMRDYTINKGPLGDVCVDALLLKHREPSPLSVCETTHAYHMRSK